MQIRPKDVLKRMLYIPIALYLGLAVYAFFFSDSAIFQPHPSSYTDTAEILKLASTDSKKISALYLPNAHAKFTLLVSHGNAEDLDDDRDWLEKLRRAGFSVFAYDYQGYGTSEGKPSEQALYDDENAAYHYLVTDLKTAPDHIIIFGRSVGSGPAVHLAARRAAAGLVLQSAFVSAFRVLTRVPILPFDKFPNQREIRRVHCPVLIMHGTADGVIDLWHGQKLFDRANEPKQSFWVKGAGHNDLDLVAGAGYVDALHKFAALLESRANAGDAGH